MKKKLLQSAVFGTVVLLAAAILTLAACGDAEGGPSGGGGGGGGGGGEFAISGKFTTNAGTSYFTAQKSSVSAAASSQRAVGRAVSPAQVPLSGTLDDGDITFRLKGFYDEESGAYTLQAASSVIKYSINGTASGSATASVAIRGSANEPFGPPTFVQVTTEITGAELADNMKSPPNTDIAEGFTKDDLWGVWRDENASYVVNEWGIAAMVKEGGEWKEDQTYGFSKIAEKPDASVDVIGDATALMESDGLIYNDADFLAYLKAHGYQFVKPENIELKSDAAPVFECASPLGGKYLVYVTCYWHSPSSGGSADKPFVVTGFLKLEENGGYTPIEAGSDFPIAAARLEDALDAGLALLIEKTEETGLAYTNRSWETSTEGLLMSRALREWKEANPEPAVGTDPNNYWNRYYTFYGEQLSAYFPQRFPNPVVEPTEKCRELRNQYMSQGTGPAEYVTVYYKWNIKLDATGKLIITPYSSNGTIETAFPGSYAEAEALNQLVNDSPIVLRR